MTRRTSTRSLLVAMIALAMLATACGGSSDSAQTTTTGDGNAVEDTSTDNSVGTSNNDASDVTQDGGDADTPTTTDTVASGGTPMSASSPIGEFFDGGFEEAVAEYTIRVEEAIVVCMAAQGFEFAATGAGQPGGQVQQRQNELTTREWTIEYGYGISTSFDSFFDEQAGNANTEIFFSMSASEREIWSQTLTGGDIADVGDQTRPLEEQGCIGQAILETGGGDAIEGLEELGSVYEEGEEALYDTREMIQAIDGWVRCMSESGFPNYTDLDAPEDEISERLDVVTAPLDGAFEDLSDEEGQALFSGESVALEDIPGLDLTALRELQADELAIAVADLDCYEAEVQEVFEPLRDDFENGLLVTYESEFDALKNIGS